jgi:hypothetical protein
MDTRSFVLPLPKQSKNILPTRLNQNHSKPIMKQKEKLLQNRSFFLEETGLFQFSFFVNNVFTGYWVKFFDFQFARHSTFVFSSCVEVTSTSAGLQFDFIAHCSNP